MRDGLPMGGSQRVDLVVNFANYRGRFLFLVPAYVRVRFDSAYV